MNDQRFDDLAKTLVTTTSRRGVLKGLFLGLVVGGAGLSQSGSVSAKDKEDKDKKKCSPDGDSCKRNDDCCDDLVCYDGACIDFNSICAGGCSPAGNPCKFNDDCCDDLVCYDGACTDLGDICTVVCTNADECPQSEDPCQVATCEDGVCGFTAAANDTPCGDGDMCTTAQTCQEGVCTGGSPVNCDDGNPCTIDTCDPDTGCVHTPSGGPGCCATAGDCPQPTSPCQVATCTDGTCGTTFVADGTACDDGNACTVGDVCQAGVCVGSPIPLIGSACNTGQPGICAQGTIVCQNDVLTCLPTQSPQPETCNGLDDNCDGQVDEGALCGPNEVCTGGSCVCMEGFADCDGVSSNGCETATNSDINNCGGCNVVCPSYGDATTICVNGICSYECPSDTRNCGTLAEPLCVSYLYACP